MEAASNSNTIIHRRHAGVLTGTHDAHASPTNSSHIRRNTFVIYQQIRENFLRKKISINFLKFLL